MTIQMELDDILEADDEDEDMPTLEHAIISANLISELRVFLKGKNLGRVVESSAEYRFLKDKKPQKGKKPYRQPDVSFIRQERLPARFDQYPEIAPDLAVEVVSPSDRDVAIESKVALYQRYGVSLVWVIHPFSRTIAVYQLASGLLPQVVGIDSELDGANVIPGFQLKTADIFDYPSAPFEEEFEVD